MGMIGNTSQFGLVLSPQIQDSAITTVKLADSAVTDTKLADSAVTSTKLVDSAVTTTKLANSAVTDTKLADSAVTTTKLLNSAVTSIKLADSAVTTSKLENNAVSLAKIARVGTAGQVLVSGGPSADPSYQNNTPPFAAGTALVFVQTAAPTGWTKSATHNDKALRIVSGTAGSGGTSAFSSVFGSRTPSGSVSVSGSVGSTTLDSSMIPSHNHIQAYGNDGGIAGRYGNVSGLSSVRIDYDGSPNNGTQSAYTSSTGGGGSHNHSFSGSGSFTGSAMDFAVQYVDAIIATKD